MYNETSNHMYRNLSGSAMPALPSNYICTYSGEHNRLLDVWVNIITTIDLKVCLSTYYKQTYRSVLIRVGFRKTDFTLTMYEYFHIIIIRLLLYHFKVQV